MTRRADFAGAQSCVLEVIYKRWLRSTLDGRRNFAQLEDFNRGGGNSEYTKQYMARMNGEMSQEDLDSQIQYLAAYAPRSKSDAKWEDTDLTSQMWSIVKNNDLRTMRALLEAAPNIAHVRSGIP